MCMTGTLYVLYVEFGAPGVLGRHRVWLHGS